MSDEKIYTVFATVSLPKDAGDEGVVTEGRYTIAADGTVTLCDLKGVPVRDQHGRTHERKPGPNETPHQVATRLTKHLRLVLLGKDEDRVGFRAPLKYPKIGYA
jgi:hypothetical protein